MVGVTFRLVDGVVANADSIGGQGVGAWVEDSPGILFVPFG